MARKPDANYYYEQRQAHKKHKPSFVATFDRDPSQRELEQWAKAVESNDEADITALLREFDTATPEPDPEVTPAPSAPSGTTVAALLDGRADTFAMESAAREGAAERARRAALEQYVEEAKQLDTQVTRLRKQANEVRRKASTGPGRLHDLEAAKKLDMEARKLEREFEDRWDEAETNARVQADVNQRVSRITDNTVPVVNDTFDLAYAMGTHANALRQGEPVVQHVQPLSSGELSFAEKALGKRPGLPEEARVAAEEALTASRPDWRAAYEKHHGA